MENHQSLDNGNMNPESDELLACLRLLASGPQEQLSFLAQQDIPDCVDELGLMFEDAGLLTQKWKLEGRITTRQFETLNSIASLLDSMSDEEGGRLWSREGLIESSEWKRVREAASTCLDLFRDNPLGSSPRKANLLTK